MRELTNFYASQETEPNYKTHSSLNRVAQGLVKVGHLKFYLSDKQYGFLVTEEDNQDIFFHFEDMK